MRGDRARNERLYLRALDIFDRRRNGFGEPILWHLALRHDSLGMLELARRLASSGTCADLGRLSDRFSAAALTYRAYRAGESFAAQNLALAHFNSGDMQGYRYWMQRAARAGNPDAAAELRRFETRLPHALARKVRRHRTYRRNDN